jgi:hypothetical protein
MWIEILLTPIVKVWGERVLKFECERENIRANNERANRLPNERFPVHIPMRWKGKYISLNEMKRHQDWLTWLNVMMANRIVNGRCFWHLYILLDFNLPYSHVNGRWTLWLFSTMFNCTIDLQQCCGNCMN